MKRINCNISENKKLNKENLSNVLYCVDLNIHDTNIDDQNRNRTIEDYCKQFGYEFVWFCKTIEEVYVGNVSDSNKIKETKKMLVKKMLEIQNLILILIILIVVIY